MTTGTVVQPYLFFGGSCEEAIAFYRKAVGAEVTMVMRFNESPEPHPPGMLPPGFEDKIMHASLRVGGTSILVSDGGKVGSNFAGFSLTMSVPTQAEAERVFGLLAEGGEVGMKLGKTFWSPCFGMLTDRFGVGWMVLVPAEGA
jgi:PhnB protein